MDARGSFGRPPARFAARGSPDKLGDVMTREYLAFDIEIAKAFPDGADWRNHRPLGISCAATLPADADEPKLWHGVTGENRPADQMSPQDIHGLVEYLQSMASQGYTILTWNGLAFDFPVLAEESGADEPCRSLAAEHVDMMFHVFCEKGFPVGLDAAAKAMGLPGKPRGMSGMLAPALWAQGKRREVLDYCAQDVRTTLDLATRCEKQGTFCWITRKGATQRMPLPGGWFDVGAAMKLPEPDTSWMSRPLARGKFTQWLRP